MKAIKRLLWRLLDAALIAVAQPVRLIWRALMFVLALNSGSAMLGVYLMAGVFLVYSVVGADAPAGAMLWRWAAFLGIAILMHFATATVARIGAGIAAAFWRWRALNVLPRLQ